jgi:uncharacterized membrane protein YgcG
MSIVERPPFVRGIATLLFALGASLACAQAWEAGTDGMMPIPPLRARVTDLTNTLSAAEAQGLEAKLAAWEQQSGNQLAVLIVPSTKPEPAKDRTTARCSSSPRTTRRFGSKWATASKAC